MLNYLWVDRLDVTANEFTWLWVDTYYTWWCNSLFVVGWSTHQAENYSQKEVSFTLMALTISLEDKYLIKVQIFWTSSSWLDGTMTLLVLEDRSTVYSTPLFMLFVLTSSNRLECLIIEDHIIICLTQLIRESLSFNDKIFFSFLLCFSLFAITLLLEPRINFFD